VIFSHGFGVRPPQDFVDINCGCPIDLVYKTGAGSGLMERTGRLRQIVTGMSRVMDCPVTVKMRVGVYKDPARWNAAQLAAKVGGLNTGIFMQGPSNDGILIARIMCEKQRTQTEA
jgi:hypothetical protein